MKTFKLKTFTILSERNGSIAEKTIQLIDGLVIDQEDDKSYWLIETYMSKSYLSYFKSLKSKAGIIVKAKISKETNDPAYFVAKIIQINDIVEHFNVLLLGSLIQRQQTDLTEWLKDRVAEGDREQQLINQLKNLNEFHNA